MNWREKLKEKMNEDKGLLKSKTEDDLNRHKVFIMAEILDTYEKKELNK